MSGHSGALARKACSFFRVVIDKSDQYIDWHWLIMFFDPGWGGPQRSESFAAEKNEAEAGRSSSARRSRPGEIWYKINIYKIILFNLNSLARY